MGWNGFDLRCQGEVLLAGVDDDHMIELQILQRAAYRRSDPRLVCPFDFDADALAFDLDQQVETEWSSALDV